MRRTAWARTTAAACAGLALAACVRPLGGTGGSGSTAPRAGGDAGFLAPPVLVQAVREPGGGVRLAGRAPPDAVVRLQAPDGRALGVTADAAGTWSAELPPGAAPALYAFTADLDGRTLRGEGALATAPPPAATPALVARAGAPAVVALSGAGAAGPELEVVDFDGGGGIAAAGRAPPGATLKLMVDGAAVGAGAADASGRFGLPGVGRALAPGLHRLRVEAAAGAAEAAVDTSAPTPLDGAPYRGGRVAQGWRVDWSTPGGGVESLVWLDARAGDPHALPAARRR